MDTRIRRLMEDGDKLFGARSTLMTWWQNACEQFYPERADFTVSRMIGQDFAEHLTTSYPMLARRSLGNSISAVLRPANLDTTAPGVWFNMRTDSDREEDNQTRAGLEWMTGVMRRAMYDRRSGFTRATKEGDHDFAAIGQCVISIQLNRSRTGILYQCHHVRDVAWCEDAEGNIESRHRKWKTTVQQLSTTFGSKVSPKVKEALSQEGRRYEDVEVRHAVVPSDQYQDGKRWKTPWVSVWFDVTNDGHVMEEVGSYSPIYHIPRFETVSGSQYALSPAAVIALPDARLVQAITLSILEAGEKMAEPPLVATEGAVRDDVNSLAGGVTWVDMEYDERLGPALRPLYEPKGGEGLRTAVELRAYIQDQIDKAFFLDSLSLPPSDSKEMTAFEVGQRISEWIRRAQPVWEPVEFDYNGGLCDMTFDLMMRNGFFGNLRDLPDGLKGQDIRFKFTSPLHENADRRKGQKLFEAKAALAQTADIDPSTIKILNAQAALRDVLKSIEVPAIWTRDPEQVNALVQQEEQQKQMAMMLAGAGDAAAAAKDLGGAAKSFADARAVAQPAA